MSDEDKTAYPVVIPVNDSCEYWLAGNPERATVTCIVDQHDWVTVPRTFDDYVICADCGRRKGWTQEAEDLMNHIRESGTKYLHENGLPIISDETEK